ncbi:MAG: hypothetical protein RIC80_19120 [Cyclobacteriaceae bacterium]
MFSRIAGGFSPYTPKFVSSRTRSEVFVKTRTLALKVVDTARMINYL